MSALASMNALPGHAAAATRLAGAGPRRCCSSIAGPRRFCSSIAGPRCCCSGIAGPRRYCSSIAGPRHCCSGIAGPSVLYLSGGDSIHHQDHVIGQTARLGIFSLHAPQPNPTSSHPRSASAAANPSLALRQFFNDLNDPTSSHWLGRSNCRRSSTARSPTPRRAASTSTTSSRSAAAAPCRLSAAAPPPLEGGGLVDLLSGNMGCQRGGESLKECCEDSSMIFTTEGLPGRLRVRVILFTLAELQPPLPIPRKKGWLTAQGLWLCCRRVSHLGLLQSLS
jgi:hypothetical protein